MALSSVGGNSTSLQVFRAWTGGTPWTVTTTPINTFDLVKYGFWSGEAIPGVSRPVTIRVRTAYSIAAT